MYRNAGSEGAKASRKQVRERHHSSFVVAAILSIPLPRWKKKIDPKLINFFFILRYQYHPPKYYRGPLHPVQTPKSSDPTARDFVPGPFSFPRLKHTYDSTIAPDLLAMTYQHKPPGTVAPESQKGTLRQWDGSSPYHKNRPSRGPRGGGSSRLGILERNVDWNNIPELEAVTINSYAPMSSQNKEYLHVARAVVQAISGAYPEVTTVKHHVIQWGVRKGDKAGAKVTLRGGAAYDFVDKLVTLVLPKIKDWPGIKASTGDDSGNLAFGMKPAWMAYFPEIEFNYDVRLWSFLLSLGFFLFPSLVY